MIKNIVFDMGNVILRWDPHYIASKLSNDSLEQDVIERELFASKQWQKLVKDYSPWKKLLRN